MSGAITDPFKSSIGTGDFGFLHDASDSFLRKRIDFLTVFDLQYLRLDTGGVTPQLSDKNPTDTDDYIIGEEADGTLVQYPVTNWLAPREFTGSIVNLVAENTENLWNTAAQGIFIIGGGVDVNPNVVGRPGTDGPTGPTGWGNIFNGQYYDGRTRADETTVQSDSGTNCSAVLRGNLVNGKQNIVMSDNGWIDDDCTYSINFGARYSQIADSTSCALIGGGAGSAGQGNAVISSIRSVVVGGRQNAIDGSSAQTDSDVIVGGRSNLIEDGSAYSGILAGQTNVITDADWALIGGGAGNTIGTGCDYTFIVGNTNVAAESAPGGLVSGQDALAHIHYAQTSGGPSIAAPGDAQRVGWAASDSATSPAAMTLLPNGANSANFNAYGATEGMFTGSINLILVDNERTAPDNFSTWVADITVYWTASGSSVAAGTNTFNALHTGTGSVSSVTPTLSLDSDGQIAITVTPSSGTNDHQAVAFFEGIMTHY